MAKSSNQKKDASVKKKSNPFKKFVSLCLIAVACYLTYSATQEFLTTLQLKKDIADAQTVIQSLETEHANLEEEKAKMENPEYVKRYVRGSYMLSKDGEQVMVYPNTNGSDKAAE